MFNLIKFFFSIQFLKHFLLGILLCFTFFVLIFFTLQFITNHNDKITVPNLESLNLSQVSKELNEIKLRFEVLDSSKYNPNYGPLTVIEHSPKFNQIVKRNRKIYLTINPSSYRQLRVPNVIQITKRNAETRLNAVGFKIGEILYVDNLGKDMVIKIKHQGSEIKPGILLPKNSVLDLVLGNGKKM